MWTRRIQAWIDRAETAMAIKVKKWNSAEP
jgi:hypothetical protein